MSKDKQPEEIELNEKRFNKLVGFGSVRTFTLERKGLFLEALAKIPNVTAALKIVKISRRTAYKHRGTDPEFCAAWDEVIDNATENLIEEGRRRAEVGVAEPIFQNGQLVGHKQKYSDTLLMFLVKARRPEFKDRVDMNHSGQIGNPDLADLASGAIDLLKSKLDSGLEKG